MAWKIELTGKRGFSADSQERKELISRISTSLELYNAHEVRVVISAHKDKKTNPQVRYYWGVVVPYVMEHLSERGYSYNKDEVHDILKMKCLQQTILAPNGEFINVGGSIEKLSVQEMAQFLHACNLLCMNWFGYAPPEPIKGFTNDN